MTSVVGLGPVADDLYVARRLLGAQRITSEELLEDLLDWGRERTLRHASGRPFRSLLVARGKATSSEVEGLLAERVRLLEEDGGRTHSFRIPLGELLVTAGAATPVQVRECLLEQGHVKASGHSPKRLGELLVEKGFTPVNEVERALSYHWKQAHFCRGCGLRFDITGARSSGAYFCGGCGHVLTSGLQPANQKDALVEPAVLPAPLLGTGAHLDQAVKVYLRQRTNVRRSDINEAERFQLELARYDLWTPILDILIRFGALTWRQITQVRQMDFERIVREPGWKTQAIPGYRVLARLATGGFGTVYAARQVLSGRLVALKVMHQDRARDASMLARFRQEAVLMMRFEHPHIVRALDYSDAGTFNYVAMDLVLGKPLDRLIRERGALPASVAVSVTQQVAEALRYMQAEGYIHRDIKPQNVLVDEQYHAKLCDLGLAQRIHSTTSGRSESTSGTARYMSPEQARGELDLKVGTDIYALGLTLYSMLAGREPFGNGGLDQLLDERFAHGVAAPDLSPVEAPEAVRELLKRMLDPRREARYRSYPELFAALDRASGQV